MQVLVRLVHAEPGTRVVEVSAQRDGLAVASALGEGPTAEAAEDRARQRLQQQLAPSQPPTPSSPQPAARPEGQAAAAAPVLPHGPAPETTATPAAAAGTAAAEEPPADPEDWSGELAQIDLQLQRIGWQREQEATYLHRAFAHPSRARITTFADLMAYLKALQALAAGSDPAQAPVPLRRTELLAQSDQLLAQLGWNASRGRRFLEQHFAAASRQLLSDSQLLQFNMLLEEALINPTTVALPSTGSGG
ncbi:MAG: hypothetical protein AAFX65_07750 [Cyanobacteria bacterium J06638_7]